MAEPSRSQPSLPLKAVSKGSHNGSQNGDDTVAKPSRLKQLQAKTGLDVVKLVLMFKGALPPTISIALYQLDGFAATFPTLGYLVAIMSMLSMAILPRSKFVQNMIFNILGVCIGSCIALLTCYCAIQARINTTIATSTDSLGSSGTKQAAQYSSSASAVAAIWLFVNVCFANTFRFFRPQLNAPVIIYSIFAMISGTYAATFSSMDQAIAFVKQLMEAFLSGFGVAIVINFLVLPITARRVVFVEMSGYVSLLQKLIQCQQNYLDTMATDLSNRKDGAETKTDDSDRNGAAKELKGTMTALNELHGKLHGDLTFAKRETALGYLDGGQIQRLVLLLRQVFIPFLGLTSVVDIFERLVDNSPWDPRPESLSSTKTGGMGNSVDQPTSSALRDWTDIASSLSPPFQTLSETMIDTLAHASYLLQLSKRPKNRNVEDPESRGKGPLPGDSGFTSHLEAKIEEFAGARKGALKAWCSQRGLEFPETSSAPPPSHDSNQHIDSQINESSRRQLYLILYMENLIHAAAVAVLEVARFADEAVESGVMRRKRLIYPKWKTIRKWIRGCLNVEDTPVTDAATDNTGSNLGTIYLGDAFRKQRDPEHALPTNSWETFGQHMRKVPQILSSPEVAFGFRVSCATMSIAIVAYLEQTQRFFFEERVVWALIMIAIGMTMTTGSGTFGLLARVIGTIVATACSLLIWYIAGGQGFSGAVIPVLFVFLFIEHYFFLRYPAYPVVFIITMVTQLLVVGYELEAEKIGQAAIAANGQKYYPISLLAPYRLAAVAGGCFVAWVFTYFPFPVTARSSLRHQLGETLYLLANYYSVVHSISLSRLAGTAGDPSDKKSPAARLEKASMKLIAKIMGKISQLREHDRFVSFEIPLGGKFPREKYKTLIQEVGNLASYMSVIAFSTSLYAKKLKSEADNQWLHDLSQVVSSVECTSQEVTCILALLSLSLTNSVPLPPYLKPPESYQLNVMLSKVDPNILGIEHFLEPGYSAFAVTQVTSKLISDDLKRVVEIVKSLVGEVDFSFHIHSTAKSEESLASTLSGKGKKD